MPLDEAQIRQLHSNSSVPYALLDDDLQVQWANEAALRRFASLALPGGLVVLLGGQTLQQLTAQAAALAPYADLSVPLIGIMHYAAVFTRLEQGFLLTIGFSAPQPGQEVLAQGLDTLAASVFGRLRSPLANVFTHVTAISQSPEAQDNDRLYDCAISINNSCYQMLRYVLDTTAYLQYTAGSVVPDTALLDLTALVDRTVQATRLLLCSCGVTLETTLPDGPLPVQGNDDMLLHALLHLLSNACAAMPDGGAVRLMLEQSGAQAVITLQDNGAGMAPAVLQHAFEPFYSYSTDGVPFAGEGLGLTLVQQIMLLHGGNASISTAPDEGTSVMLRLPLAENADPKLQLKTPTPAVDLLRDRFSLLHVILSGHCGAPLP